MIRSLLPKNRLVLLGVFAVVVVLTLALVGSSLGPPEQRPFAPGPPTPPPAPPKPETIPIQQKQFKWVNRGGATAIGQFNNQLLMAMCASHISDLTNRKIVAQPWNLLSTEFPRPRVVHFGQVFNTTKGLRRYYEFPEDTISAEVLNKKDDLDLWEDGKSEDFVLLRDLDLLWSHPASKVAMEGSDIAWYYCYHKYLLCTALKCSLWDNIVDLFAFSDQILAFVDPFIRDNNLERAIGVHLRAGDMKAACGRVDKFDLGAKHLFYSCYQGTSAEIIDNIVALDLGLVPIFLATNHRPNDPILIDLKAHFSDRLFFLGPLGDQEFLRSIVESLILTKMHWFLGNYYSTFTGNVAFRRHFHNVAYFKASWGQRFFPGDYLTWILPLLLFLASIRIHLATSRRWSGGETPSWMASTKSTIKIWLGVGSIVAIVLFGLPFEAMFSVVWFVEAPFVCLFTPFCVTQPLLLIRVLFLFAAVAGAGVVYLKWRHRIAEHFAQRFATFSASRRL